MERGSIRFGSERDTAVLFVHGIVGRPRHFEDFLPLVPQSMTVCNVLLDGHGGSVDDFSHTSMQKWKRQIDRRVRFLLNTHKSIVIVAHSMGCLFAIKQAIKHPQRVKALFLLAAPLDVRVRPELVVNVCKVYLDRISPDDVQAQAAQYAYGIEHDYRIWKYFGWIPRYLELFGEIGSVRKCLDLLSVKTYMFQSKYDEIVPISTTRLCYHNSSIHTKILKNSHHFYYEPDDYRYLLSYFERFITNIE
jgi:esterase/lipase